MHPADPPPDPPLDIGAEPRSVGPGRADVTVDSGDGRRDGASLTRRSRVSARTKRFRIGLAAAVVLVLVALGLAAVTAAARSATVGGSTTIPLDAPGAGASPQPTDGDGVTGGAVDTIYVHVLGAVLRPGLYTLASDARVVDAIAAAGGLTGEADAGSINLARTLTDGEQIVVLTPGEAPTTPEDGVASPGGGAAATGGGPVNLNTATAEQLDTLPRIGPALADRIISWRTENGPFRLVDELLNVPGIGDATLAGLEGLVTV